MATRVEMNAWLAKFGVAVPSASASAAAPRGAGTKAPQSAEPMAGRPPRATGTVKTRFGDFVYFVDSKPLVEPVISEIVDEYSAAEDLQASLEEAGNELESLDEKYKDMTADDIEREIIHYTTGTLKDEAGAARGAGIVDAGFKAFLDQLVEEVGTAKQNIKITSDDLKAQELSDQAAESARIGKELQESQQALLEGFTKVLEVAAHVSEAVAAPEFEAGPYFDLAADLFSTFSAGSNDWLKQAAKLEDQAKTLRMGSLASRASMAKETLQNLQKGVKTWQPIVAKAGHDLETKQATRDNNYDSKKADSKASKSFNFGEIKKGIELAKQVHDVGMRTLAGAQNTRTLVIGVQNVHRNQKPEEWMGKPAQCQKVLDGFAGATHEMGQGAEAKIKWSKALLKRFETFYSEAGEAMADAPGTSH
jgi:hypothetical protein